MARDVASGVIVGIDIGGSKTRALAVADGKIVGEALAGSANLQSVTDEQAKTVFADIFSGLSSGLRPDTITRVSAGSAGVDTEQGAQALIRLLRPHAPDAEITAVHDTQLILAAGGLSAGIAVISGTGSVAWGKRADGETARVGGWGYLLGDDGSGYGVSRSAVRHALSLSDRGEQPDALSRRFAAECGVTEPAQLLDHFYAQPERRYWAKMAGLVFELAADGDAAAQVITRQTAIDLAALIEGVCVRLGPGLPVVLGGGLLANQPGLVAAITERTRATGVSDINVLQREPVFGALALAGVDVEGIGEPMTAGTHMADEIRQQPAVWARLLAEGRPAIAEVAAKIIEYPPRFVLFVARGTSDHAALYGKYLTEIIWQVPAGLASPSTMTTYGARPDLSGVLVIGVSQSGGSPDLVQTLSVAREQGALTVAVTNAPQSPLAKVAEYHLDVLAGPELAVAATKSYTAQLLALYLLLTDVAGRDNSAADLLPARGEEVLHSAVVQQLATRYRFASRLVTTGRGYSYPTAREAALKLMETSYLSAQAFSGADLLHGPLAMIDQQVPVIAIVPDGVGGRAMDDVLHRLAGRGADVCCVGSADAVAATGLGVTLEPTPEELSPMLAILPLQMLALQLAIGRGENPDVPRGLSKVTETL